MGLNLWGLGFKLYAAGLRGRIRLLALEFRDGDFTSYGFVVLMGLLRMFTLSCGIL